MFKLSFAYDIVSVSKKKMKIDDGSIFVHHKQQCFNYYT